MARRARGRRDDPNVSAASKLDRGHAQCGRRLGVRCEHQKLHVVQTVLDPLEQRGENRRDRGPVVRQHVHGVLPARDACARDFHFTSFLFHRYPRTSRTPAALSSRWAMAVRRLRGRREV